MNLQIFFHTVLYISVINYKYKCCFSNNSKIYTYTYYEQIYIQGGEKLLLKKLGGERWN